MIKLWEDKWIGEASLQSKFLYVNSNKTKKFEEVGRWNENTRKWCMNQRKEWFEWERDQVVGFM